MSSAGPEPAEGEVVRTILDLVLDPRAPYGKTVAVVWACTACRVDRTAPDVGTALASLGTHLYDHHHRGAALRADASAVAAGKG